tara:strand:- start:113 stop:844 length:732 start_codon:yes stop_codon:yes gene_type:complete
MKSLKDGLAIWQILNSNIITDIIGKSGFDIAILDLEHGLHTPKTIQDCVFTAKANSLFTIARLPSCSYENLVQLIDTGVDAILFPHIETKSQLNKIINQSFLPPLGNKSFSPFVPKFNYEKSDEGLIKNPHLGILIESILGINNAEELLKEQNIDFVYFGAYDLSVEINKPGEIFNSEIVNYLKNLIKHAKNYKKKILAIYRNKKELDLLNQLGVDIPVASVDTSHLIMKLKEEKENYLKIKN